jgi:hypothetical protein
VAPGRFPAVRDDRLWSGCPRFGTLVSERGGGVLKALPWIAAILMLVGGIMLLVGSGAPVIWFSDIAVGVALVVVYRAKRDAAV